HIVIISREYPVFSMARLSAKRKMYEMRTDELGFSENEAAELLEKIYAYKYNSESLAFLTENFGGWITGIHLILHAYRKGYDKVRPGESKMPEEIFNFFAEEIFSRLEDDMQDFLINTALLDNFIDKMSDWLLNSKNSKKIIDTLANTNILIHHH